MLYLKSGLFKRMFLLFAVLLAGSLLIIELSVTRSLRKTAVHSLHDSLEVQADLIARSVPLASSANLDDVAIELKHMAHARVTIIAPSGKVIGDSDHASSTMDNHRDRIEVQQADLSGTGMAIRMSDTLKTDLLYVARKVVRDGKPQGFIRLSVSLSDVNALVRRMRVGIFAVVVVVLAVGGLIVAWQIDRLRRLTLQVRDFAGSIARGDLGHRLFLQNAGEYEEIAGSLNDIIFPAGTAWLERLGLADKANAKVEELSKGMQQKVQFAGAVIHDPELVILDEPFTGLDPIATGSSRTTSSRCASAAAPCCSRPTC